MQLKSYKKAPDSLPATVERPSASEAPCLAHLDLDAYSMDDLAKLQQRIDTHMLTPINKLNLLTQTTRLYHIAQGQLDRVLTSTSNTPANQVASTINTLQTIIVNLTKHEGLIYSADRLTAFERAVVAALSIPEVTPEARIAFYTTYEGYLGETLVKFHD